MVEENPLEPRFVVWLCDHCRNGIEFDAVQLAGREACQTECPHCGRETSLQEPPPPPPLVPDEGWTLPVGEAGAVRTAIEEFPAAPPAPVRLESDDLPGDGLASVTPLLEPDFDTVPDVEADRSILPTVATEDGQLGPTGVVANNEIETVLGTISGELSESQQTADPQEKPSEPVAKDADNPPPPLVVEPIEELAKLDASPMAQTPLDLTSREVPTEFVASKQAAHSPTAGLPVPVEPPTVPPPLFATRPEDPFPEPESTGEPKPDALATAPNSLFRSPAKEPILPPHVTASLSPPPSPPMDLTPAEPGPGSVASQQVQEDLVHSVSAPVTEPVTVSMPPWISKSDSEVLESDPACEPKPNAFTTMPNSLAASPANEPVLPPHVLASLAPPPPPKPITVNLPPVPPRPPQTRAPMDVRWLTDLGVVYFRQHQFGEAFLCFSRAAQQGFATAQFCLAVCYFNGQGTKQDEAAALPWLHKAAAQGDANAEFTLGLAYRLGRGVVPDEMLALQWLMQAAKHGHPEAIKRVGETKGRISVPMEIATPAPAGKAGGAPEAGPTKPRQDLQRLLLGLFRKK